MCRIQKVEQCCATILPRISSSSLVKTKRCNFIITSSIICYYYSLHSTKINSIYYIFTHIQLRLSAITKFESTTDWSKVLQLKAVGDSFHVTTKLNESNYKVGT